MSAPAASLTKPRLDWIDTARGLCIILVVLMHVEIGFEVELEKASWLDPFIEWARPFRMPAFFMVSGVLGAGLISRGWRELLERRVLGFIYFYVLWLAIHCLLKFTTWGAGDLATLFSSFGHGLIQPFGLLWFIYLLAVFFLVTRAFRSWPLALWLLAALLAILPVATGSTLIDQFAGRYVYFVTGVVCAPALLALAAWLDRNRGAAAMLWLVWAAGSAGVIAGLGPAALAGAPFAALALGLAGSIGLIATAVLGAPRLGWVAFCGRQSLTIYLAFFIPMALTRVLILRSGVEFDIGLTTLALTALCVAFPLALHRAVQGTPLAFLFERPGNLRLAAGPATSAMTGGEGSKTGGG